MKGRIEMLADYIERHREPFDSQMFSWVEREDIPEPLKAAMLYSLKVGGKRLRPVLMFAVLESLGCRAEKGYRTAAALELIHTYSLVHDDLPAMDDDDFRRGQPTNHKVFGDATAILAGDGLLTFAFELIAGDEGLDPVQKVALISALAKASGPSGMIAGQVLDMEAEGKKATLAQLKGIHARKTGLLIAFAIEAGAIIGGSEELVQLRLRRFSEHLGLAFQIQDDILDVEGDSEVLGKLAGSDALRDKCTYVSLTSLEQAKQMLADEIGAAKALLDELSIDTTLLEALAVFIQERKF